MQAVLEIRKAKARGVRHWRDPRRILDICAKDMHKKSGFMHFEKKVKSMI